MGNIEFYIVNHELWYRFADGETSRLTAHDIDIVQQLYDDFCSYYPEAIRALAKLYAKSKPLLPLYRYKIVNRFCRCNFGAIDNVFDIDQFGRYHFEYVQCPLRGECPLENIVCNPQFNSRLRPSELRVFKLLVDGLEKDAIADTLCLSIATVNNHINNVYQRLGIHSLAEFLRYAHKFNIFSCTANKI